MQVGLLPEQRRDIYGVLKILAPVQPMLELKFVVPDRKTANKIYKKWEEKAADVYSVIYENLCD